MRLPRLLRILIAFVLVAATVVTASSPASAQVDLAAEEARLVDLHNLSRTEDGISPLVRNAGLDQVARDWAEHMARTQNLEHRSDLFAAIDPHTGGTATRVAENILWFGWVPGEADGHVGGASHTAWMNSAGHRTNIMNPDYNQVGVGFFEFEGEVWGAVNFMTAPLPLAFSDTLDVTTGYSATEHASVLDAAAYLDISPETFQRYGVALMRFLNALAGIKDGRSPVALEVPVGNDASATTTWSGDEELETLGWVTSYYGVSAAEAQKAGASLLTFLVGLDRQRTGN